MDIKINFTGDIWTAIGSISTFIAVLVALIPFFRENSFTKKKNRILKLALKNEVEIIHESYFGKIYDFVLKNKVPNVYEIPKNDYQYFIRIENFQNEFHLLNKNEKIDLMNLVNIFRKSTYRKNGNNVSKIEIGDIKVIEDTCNNLLQRLDNSITSNRKKCQIKNYRKESYTRITNIKISEGKDIVSEYKNIETELINEI